MLLWQTDETPETRALGTNAPTGLPAALPLYLLDGQQRLTSLHRVFSDDQDAQVVFNVATQKFQNQSAATAKDPRWIKVYPLLAGEKLFARVGRLDDAIPELGDDEIFARLQRVQEIAKYRYHLEIISDMGYAEVTEIFVRVNSGGRSLKATDLALATLSARWPGVVGKLEAEAEHWRALGWGDLDVGFLTRALSASVLGRGLSQWSLGKLTGATDEELEKGWDLVRAGLRRAVPLLKNNIGVTHSSLLPSALVIIPLVEYLGAQGNQQLPSDMADGLLYWFLVATIRARYSGSTDTVISQDIAAVRKDQPLKALMENLGLLGSRVTVTEQTLAGRGQSSPYFFLSFLVAQKREARDWWYGTQIAAGGSGQQKLQYHHIHPRGTLKSDYSKQDVNDLANLAFISGAANLKISDRSPSVYFPEVGAAELERHLVPVDEHLRTADVFPDFVKMRRGLLASAMTDLLDGLRPAWLDEHGSAEDPLSGAMLDLEMFVSEWDEGRLVIRARTGGVSWEGDVGVDALESALEEARGGISGDLDVSGESCVVRPVEDRIEVQWGPFAVTGTVQDWADVLDRERADARPRSDLTEVTSSRWSGERVVFPVVNSE